MAKVSHQLILSFRWYSSFAVAAWALCPACQAVWANDYQPVAVYAPAGHPGPGSFAPGMYPLVDISCEPSFRGGDCHNCCLDLWQNYCAQRVDCHCGVGYGGLFRLGGCLGHGCHGRCTSCSVGHCSTGQACHAASCSSQCQLPAGGPVVQPQPPAVEAQPWSNGAPAPQPPANPLPSDTPPAPPEPSASSGAASRVQTAQTSPLPPAINFAAHPASHSVPVVPASSKPNAGTARLLQQLRSH
jgi:hypothetical protein